MLALTLKQVMDNDEISRLVLLGKTKLVISCAYPGNYFLFPSKMLFVRARSWKERTAY